MTVTHISTARPAPAPPTPGRPPRGRRLAVINNKGGVGKTTVTRELAAAFARRGQRVLAVDFDPQGNLTTSLNVTTIETDGSIADVLDRPAKGAAAKAITGNGWTTPEAHLIDVLPADLELEARGEEAALPGSHGRLHRILYGVTDAYDYTLIDCRPALGHLEQMVVAALDSADDGVLIVVEPGRYAISGATRVMTQVAEWAERLDVEAPVLGVVVNRCDERTNLHRGRLAGMPASLAAGTPLGVATPPVLRPHIPHRIRLAELTDLATGSSGDQRLDREGLLALFDDLAVTIDALPAVVAP